MVGLTTKYKKGISEDSTNSPKELIPIRVKDIILDSSHKEYTKYGKEQSIGVIKYTRVDTKQEQTDTESLPHAFPINSFNITYPLVNEVVLLIRGPREDKNLGAFDYYSTIVGLYNDINWIPSDDSSKGEGEPGYNFKVNSNIRPLHPFHGDAITQGRNGQSIRLTGASSPLNPFTDSSNANQPLTIISNGHTNIEENEFYIEDINKDQSSIYLTTNHLIPLTQARDKYAGAKERPIKADQFKGKQIIINSGRLFFNSTEEDIQLSSRGNFGVTSNNISLDGTDYVGIDASKIYLGEDAKRFEFQPAILGTQLETFLVSLLAEIERMAEAMKNAKTVDGKIIPALNITGPISLEMIRALQKWPNPGKDSLLKSKKVFIE